MRLLHRLPLSRLAEGPVWDARANRLQWVDIAGHAIHRYDPATGEGATHAVSDAIGFALPTTDGGIVAGIRGAIRSLVFGEDAETDLARPAMHPENRFNDGKCDPRGRLWAGTMHKDATAAREPTGALYRWSDGGLEVVVAPVSLSNGLGWSPDGATMYFSDTHAGTVWAYNYHLATGTVGQRRVFARIPHAVGVPDGLTVDAAGRVFVAIWRGGCVNVYAPCGELEATLAVPVRNPTSCCFGGSEMRTLFVTTMPSDNESDLRSGSVFALDLATPGLPSAAMEVEM